MMGWVSKKVVSVPMIIAKAREPKLVAMWPKCELDRNIPCVTVEGASPPKKPADAPLIAIRSVHAFFYLSWLAHLTPLTVSLWPLPGEKPPMMSLTAEGLSCSLKCANKKKLCSPPAVWALSLLDPSNVNSKSPSFQSISTADMSRSHSHWPVPAPEQDWVQGGSKQHPPLYSLWEAAYRHLYHSWLQSPSPSSMF